MYAATDEATSGAVGEMTEWVWVAVRDAVDGTVWRAVDGAVWRAVGDALAEVPSE